MCLLAYTQSQTLGITDGAAQPAVQLQPRHPAQVRALGFAPAPCHFVCLQRHAGMRVQACRAAWVIPFCMHAGTTKRTAATSTRVTSAARTTSSRSGTTLQPRPDLGCMQDPRAWKRACAWVQMGSLAAPSMNTVSLADSQFCYGVVVRGTLSTAARHLARGPCAHASTSSAAPAGSLIGVASPETLTCHCGCAGAAL